VIFDWRDFDNALADVGRECLVCHGSNTELDPRLFSLRALNEGDDPDAPTGPVQLCGLLVCNDCGFIRLHALRLGKTHNR
jgi:hypothetical protein